MNEPNQKPISLVTIGPLTFKVRVLEEKHVFGRTCCLIEPMDGGGQQWVNKDKLVLEKSVEEQPNNSAMTQETKQGDS